MAKEAGIRFTIDAKGEPRTLFSAYERSNGTVYIRPKKEAYFRFPGQHPAQILKPIRISSQKYSIHASKDSPEKVNTIHSTTVIEGYEPLEWRHLTKAVKSEVGFAFLNLRRCSDLAQPSFVSKQPAQTAVSLGEYDPSLFTLFYAIAVGARGVAFNHDGKTDVGVFANHQMNVIEHELEKSRLIVMWSFLAAPSHYTSLIFHNTTVPPVTPEQHKEMLGRSNQECVELFGEQCGVLEHEQQGLMMIDAGKPFNEPYRIPIRRWHQDGLKDTGMTKEYVEGVTGRVLTL